jgi:histidinol-phosphatase (PHP family)
MNIDKKSDGHMHTVFSDGMSPVDEMVTAAMGKGLKAITITDHMPLPFDNRYAMHLNDIERYRSEIELARQRYAGQITVNAGLEMEYLPAFAQWIHSIVDLGWDHLLVSVHHLFMDDRPCIVNGTQNEFEILVERFDHNMQALCSTYYETVRMAVQTAWFDIVGDLDVSKKHNPNQRYFDDASEWYRDMVADTLDSIANHDIKMEINMSGLNHPNGEPYPSRWIVQAAAKRDIQFVLGSDAHTPESLGQYFHRIDEWVAFDESIGGPVHSTDSVLNTG